MNAGTYRELLRNGGFHSFLWTQFVEAFNDNVYKVVVSLLAVEMALERGGGQYLSRANGLLEMTTFLGIILGTTAGSLLLATWKTATWRIGIVLAGIAVAGVVTSLGISYFWFLGARLQMDLLLFAKEALGVGEVQTGIMVASLAIGIGAGSMAAGRLIAANNFLNTLGVLVASGMLWLLHDRLHVSAAGIILIFGVFTILATVYIASLVSDFYVRFLLWMLTHTFYRIGIKGAQNVPVRGPALLVANHVTMIDGFLLGACIQRFVRFMVNERIFNKFGRFFRRIKAISVPVGTHKDIVIALRRARQELVDGHVVCIFAEGELTRTGNMFAFHRGLEKIVSGLDVPVIPVYLGGVWGSIFSFRDGRLYWKWPRQIPFPITVSFGSPMRPPVTPQQVRQAVLELAAAAGEESIPPRDLLQTRFIRTARKNWSRLAMADSTGKELTYGKALIASLLLAERLKPQLNPERTIGIMLPATVGGALANVGVLMAGGVPVNLNFTAGREAVSSAIEQCRISTVLTSRVFLGKLKFEPPPGAVFLEDLLAQFSKPRTLLTAAKARLLPVRVLERLSNPNGLNSGSLATVIFSSGSTGRPKGVMLTHKNIIANVGSIDQLFSLTQRDRLAGVLPFFHSFGFTVTIWFPLLTGAGVVYHPDPLDAKAVGALVARYQATLLLATPTFAKSYTRVCTPEQFSTLRFAIVGAEKLPEAVAQAFEDKFGLPLLEGYGATEMAPVIAVNVSNVEDGSFRQAGNKSGTVGHPLPGVAVKVVHPDSGEPLPYGQEGLLLVKGANRMAGYLGQPEQTQAVLRDGWYITGDIARIDNDGFVRITDRLSRFSKIAGEMVPHLRIEEAIRSLLGDHGCAVIAVPDEQKGERLVVFHTKPGFGAQELWEGLSRTELPKLWIPRKESIRFIDALPTIGTGKLDLLRLRTLAAS